MGKEVRLNLDAARRLFDEAQKLKLGYGCVEVCLLALGSGSGPDLVDLLKGNPSERSNLLDIIQRKGFILSWVVNVPVDITGEDIKDLLEGKIPLPPSRPPGKLAGYLCAASYSDENRENHVIAILPRQHMPRDRRRRLKEKRSYVVMDTGGGGVLQVTTDGLAHYANQVIRQGGEFAISQLWK